MKRFLTACAALALLFSAPAPAYYYFVHYLPGGNAPEKFDLNALQNQTVTFFVSENGPTAYTQTDTFNSVIAQVQQAVQIWNGVSSSAIRVAFGGLENSATAQNTPGGDVLFEDLPPGVEGFGGPTSLASPGTTASGSPFFPIVRSVLYLNANLTVAPGPSFNQSFLMTTLHEMGHALGLQHTFTSSTMSQATTRATNLTHPLDLDDIAAISALYPNGNLAQTGSITGKITAGGNGVHLASVVAIQAGSGALSGVTNPDGTFRIDGVPPGNYAVYVHTMPPDANIIGPWDASGNTVAASGPVNALFYPGTTNPASATAVQVQAGQITSGINIATTTLPSVPFYDGQVYAYLNGTIAVTPGPVSLTAPTTMAASVTGLGSNGKVTGLNVSVVGGAVTFQNQGYQANGYTYVALYPTVTAAAQPGPQHLIFATPSYLYVLPSGFYLTSQGTPGVSSVTANGDGTVTVTGTNWSSNTLIYFDSLPASIVSLNASAGVAVVTPPPGAANQTATVTAYNSDGQNSQFIPANPASSVQFAYGNTPAPLITAVNPVASLPAGAEAMLDITAIGTNFQSGFTTVGFGTSDVLVQRVFVLSPTHLQVDVSVSANAALSNADLSIVTGFQLATSSGSFLSLPAVAGLPTPNPNLTNAYPGLTNSYAGAVVSLYGSNLAAPKATPSITIAGQTAQILYASPGQINLQIPSNLSPGPAILQLNNGVTNAYPIDVNIDTPPAGIAAIQSAAGKYIDSGSPLLPGETIIVTLSNLAPTGSTIAAGQVQMTVGGVSYTASAVAFGSGVWQVTFPLDSHVPVGSSEPLIVYLNGRSSLPAFVPVASH